MLGGAWYDQYIGNKDSHTVQKEALQEVQKHLKISVQPKYEDFAILDVSCNKNGWTFQIK